MKSKSHIPNLPIPAEFIVRRIYFIRGQKVMLDSDLAGLYKVATFRLNESVKRNKARFPNDFMFQLTRTEAINLTSQFAISSHGGRRSLPYAFTEHGVAMLSSILNSERAIQMNIFIVRAFIQMRQLAASNNNLEKRLDKMEDLLKLHDEVLIAMAEDIKKFKNPPKTKAIGFEWKNKK